MSRFKKFAHSLASGYLLIGVNIFYTLATLPLALAYLSAEEFGLWAGITAIAGQLQLLVDFGMSSSVSRILIDHKDDRDSDVYGTVVKTGFLALAVQGLLVAIVGGVLSFWLPQILRNVPEQLWITCRWLMAGQCALLGLAFGGRIFNFVLQAHQRYDAGNYAQIGGFAVALLTMWVGLEGNLGLYSLLVASAANLVFVNVCYLVVAWRTRLLPKSGRWGRADWQTFRGIFSYANDVFLLSLGQVLIGISQVPMITWTLGLTAVAGWTTMTKTFTLTQQLIARIFDYSSAAFAEMMVRGERERLHARFRDVTLLTGSISVTLCLAVAVCNHSFVQIWMSGRFSWDVCNDLLMALFVIVAVTTRCHIGLAGLTKQIRSMKFVYFIEGLLFLAASFLLTPGLGLAGIIVSGIATNLLCSGWYGLRRTIGYLNVSVSEVLWGWLKRPAQLFVVLLVVAVVAWSTTRLLSPFVALALNAGLFAMIGTFCFWRIGLPPNIRAETTALLMKWRARPRPG